MFGLVDDIRLQLLTDWFSMPDIVKLDWAVTNWEMRAKWFSDLAKPACILQGFSSDYEMHRESYCSWIDSRGARVRYLRAINDCYPETLDLSTLEELCVVLCYDEERLVAVLQSCSNLTSLSLSGGLGSIQTLLAAVPSVSMLLRLVVDPEDVDQDLLRFVSESCPILRELHLTGSSVHEESIVVAGEVPLNPSSNFPSLVLFNVWLDNVSLDGDLIEWIVEGCTNLTSVELSDCGGSVSSVDFLAPHATSLRSLTIEDTSRDETIEPDSVACLLRKCGQLQSLRYRCWSDAEDESIVKCLPPTLTSLVLEDNEEYSDSVLKQQLSKLPLLERLELNNFRDFDDSLLSAVGQHCPRLRFCAIPEYKERLNYHTFTPAGLFGLLLDCPVLVSVDVAVQLNETALLTIASLAGQRLRRLRVVFLDASRASVTDFRQQCPALEELALREQEKDDDGEFECD